MEAYYLMQSPLRQGKDLLSVVSDIESGDLNVGAANEHEAEDGAEARNRAKNEEPKLPAKRKTKFANEDAAENHPDHRRGNHHHACITKRMRKIKNSAEIETFSFKNLVNSK